MIDAITSHLNLQKLFPIPESVDYTTYINGIKLLKLILKKKNLKFKIGLTEPSVFWGEDHTEKSITLQIGS
jgi:hypothetical protein